MKRLIVLASLVGSSVAFADLAPFPNQTSEVTLSGNDAKNLYFTLAKQVEKADSPTQFTKEYLSTDKSVSIKCSATGRSNNYTYECTVSVAPSKK